ncbi:hypothetical protein PF011_g30058 [Phytophthora fragariae]|uniref:Uncharacterized protein n=1 Tax=Phytophthora fragariae TaxID=53985 RepID=A0A6A3GU60_9STRA|nr:hypothetical protein PF011_g30058 [Phytophthora fragariae]
MNLGLLVPFVRRVMFPVSASLSWLQVDLVQGWFTCELVVRCTSDHRDLRRAFSHCALQVGFTCIMIQGSLVLTKHLSRLLGHICIDGNRSLVSYWFPSQRAP